MDNCNLTKYYKQITEFQEFCLISTNGVLINKIFNLKNQLKPSNKNYKQLLLISERWNELVNVLNIARFYLRESIKESYDIEFCNSIYSTRMMHLYSANIWYNSIIDYILQFYYLLDNAKDINDKNYGEFLRDGKKRNNNIRKQCIPSEDLDAFEQMCEQLLVREKGNDVKHRRLNIMPQNYRNKYGIGVIPSISVVGNGRPRVEGNDITPLSSDKIQQNTETFESLLTTLIKTDKIVSAYMQKMKTKYIDPNI